jgi:hypothetical protein
MSSQQVVPPVATTDLRAEFAALSSVAVAVLTEHTDDRGLCAVCRCAWPCAQVVLADHNLAAL